MPADDLRPRFFEGQYLGAADLAQIVAYARTGLVRHALGCHVWGISTGLDLIERMALGAADRVEVTLTPGFAWDGFGRPIAHQRVTRLPEDLFTAIPYSSAVDDTSAGGQGRLVEVWLAYDELASGTPAPGFETCAAGPDHARLTETFRFVIGPQPPNQQRAPVTVGTLSGDAEGILKRFDPGAERLYDTSVPHQSFPQTGRPPSWLVPVGLVRWIARDGALGYFAKRDLNAADQAEGRIRAFRRYSGVVAERVLAADGALVLARRGDKPTDHGRFATRLAATLDPKAVLDDLVWVEGNLRVIGDARLCDGRLSLRDLHGDDKGNPVYLDRRDHIGSVDLRVVIGAASGAKNRLIVGPEDTGPSVLPRLVVQSGGNVGIGRADPETRLNVVGGKIRLQDAVSPTPKRIDLATDSTGVALLSDSDTITLRAHGSGGKDRLLLNPEDGDGAVGLRVKAPKHDIDAKGRSIKLGLEENGGGQLVLLNNPDDNKIYLEGFSKDGSASADEMLVTGRFATQLPAFTIRADTASVSGSLGIGTGGPAAPLHVAGDWLLVDGPGNERAALGSESQGSVTIGSREPGASLLDMRALDESFSTSSASAWLTVWCRDVHLVSDAAAKEDVQSLNSSLDRIARLRGVSYRFKGETVRTLGLVAQEVEQVVPEAVTTRAGGRGLSYMALVPVLIEAVKELKAEVEDLRAQLDGRGEAKP